MKQAVCPACGTGNRIGEGDPAAAKCGRCGAKLFTGAPIDVGDAEFESHVKMTVGPVLVDIWAPWCGPCRMMGPHFAEAARRLEPQIRFLKLNADKTAAPAKLGARSIPTLILFDDGHEIARQSGAMSAEQLISWLKRHLDLTSSTEKQL